MPTRVLIVDDHERFRHAARRMLESSGWTVVAEAADAAGAISAVDAHGPDVVLLDVGLPDASGLDVARMLSARKPAPVVVLVSTHDSSDYRQLALESGARGFIAKSSLSGTVLAAVIGG